MSSPCPVWKLQQREAMAPFDGAANVRRRGKLGHKGQYGNSKTWVEYQHLAQLWELWIWGSMRGVPWQSLYWARACYGRWQKGCYLVCAYLARQYRAKRSPNLVVLVFSSHSARIYRRADTSAKKIFSRSLKAHSMRVFRYIYCG